MSQQLCALTLMALILGYGTFAAPQLVMRPVNQAKEIGYQGKSGLPRPKIRRNTTFTSTKNQAHTSPGEPHRLERMWTKSWAQSASWTGLGVSKVAILWIYKLFFSREKHEKRVEINEVSEVSSAVTWLLASGSEDTFCAAKCPFSASKPSSFEPFETVIFTHDSRNYFCE